MDSFELDRMLEKIVDPESVQPHETEMLLVFLLAGLLNKTIRPEHFKWFLGLSCEEKTRLMKQRYFVPVTEFKITIPADYTPPETWKRLGFKVDYQISDGHFNHPSVALVPGKKYIVKIVQMDRHYIAREVNDYRGHCEYLIDACLEYMKKDGAVLCGVYGLLAAYQQGEECLPHNQQIISIDELKQLPTLDRGDDPVKHVPYLYIRESDNRRSLNAGFIGDINYDSCLLYLVEDKE